MHLACFEASEGMVDPFDDGQLPGCLRDFLRPYFTNIQLGSFKTISPVDDARFSASKIPATIGQGAVTLGLYDILYDPSSVDLTGGQDKSSIGVISEELYHTVQFSAFWESMEKHTGAKGSYIRARDSWAVAYLGESAKIVATNLGLSLLNPASGSALSPLDVYKTNKYELEAKALRGRVEDDLVGKKSPCYP
jgi:hypothetical protein